MINKTQNLPDGWISTTLEYAVEIHDNLREPVNSEERSKRTGPYPYYGATGQVGWIDGFKQDGEYVLLGEDGAPFFDLVKEKAYLVSGKCWVNNHAHVLKGRNGLCLNKYLLHSLNQTNYRGYANGTTRLKLTQSAMRGLPINLAPLNEQRRIVAKIEELFSELDNGVASLKTAKEQLKVYRQAVLKHAFEGKLTAKWRAQNADKLETPEQLLARIQTERETRYQQQLEEWKEAVKHWEASGKQGKKPTKPKEPEQVSLVELSSKHYLSEMPKQWVCLKAEHLCDFITKGTTPEKSELLSGKGDIPFIKVYNLTKNGRLDFTIEPTFIKNGIHQNFLARSKVYPNDVLMNIVGPPLGKVSIVPNTFNEWNINQAIAIYRSHFLLPKFLAEFLLFEKTVNFMMSQSKATAGQFNLTLEICRELPIPVPSQAEQIELVKKLEEKLSNLDAVATSIDEQLEKAETLRQSILKKAFSGQLVPQDANDEPASELLKKVIFNRKIKTQIIY